MLAEGKTGKTENESIEGTLVVPNLDHPRRHNNGNTPGTKYIVTGAPLVSNDLHRPVRPTSPPTQSAPRR